MTTFYDYNDKVFFGVKMKKYIEIIRALWCL